MVEGGEGLRAVVQTDEKESINARRRQTAQRESTRFKRNLQGELRRKSESPWEGKRFTLDLTEQLVLHVLALRLTMRPSVSRKEPSAGALNAETVTSDLCCCFNKTRLKQSGMMLAVIKPTSARIYAQHAHVPTTHACPCQRDLLNIRVFSTQRLPLNHPPLLYAAAIFTAPLYRHVCQARGGGGGSPCRQPLQKSARVCQSVCKVRQHINRWRRTENVVRNTGPVRKLAGTNEIPRRQEGCLEPSWLRL